MIKVMKKAVLVVTASAGLMMLWGCASTGAVDGQDGKLASTSGYSILGKETTVVDWDGRTLGAEASPVWLAAANRGISPPLFRLITRRKIACLSVLQERELMCGLQL